MADGTQRPGARALLRSAGIVVAVISAAVAVFLIVFSEASRSAQFGVLLGLWSALILALSVVRGQEPGESAQAAGSVDAVPEDGPAPAAVSEGASEAAAVAPVEQPGPTVEELAASMTVELRRSAELERQAAAAERREFQLQLELMLRREVEQVMQRELMSLRQEIAALRAEILDNVGGQLRLERIETTRLIGSDVQALQQEIRRLASVREALESSMDGEDAVFEDAQFEDVQFEDVPERADIVDADIADEAAEDIAADEAAEAAPVADEAGPAADEAAEAGRAADEAAEAAPVADERDAAAVDTKPADEAPSDEDSADAEPPAEAESTASAVAPADADSTSDSEAEAEADVEADDVDASAHEAPDSAQDRPAAPRHAPGKRTFDFADLPTVSRLTPLPAEPQASRYTGRRRAPADAPAESAGDSGDSAGGGGQRRAREGSEDVLARLLGR